MAAKFKGKKKSPFIGKTEALNDAACPILYQRYNSLQEIMIGSTTAVSGVAQEGGIENNKVKSKRTENTNSEVEGAKPAKKKKKAVDTDGEIIVTDAHMTAHDIPSSNDADNQDAAQPADDTAKDAKKKKKEKKKKAREQAAATAEKVKHSGPANQEEALKFRETLGIAATAASAPPCAPARHFAFGFDALCDRPDGGASTGTTTTTQQQQDPTPDSEQQEDEDDDVGDAAGTQNASKPATSSRVERISNVDSEGFVPRRVYVGGMPFAYTEEQIRELWGECGEIEALDMLRFPDTGKFRGIAFITYATEEGYQQALQYNGDNVEGQTLVVKRCTPPTAKQQEQIERRKPANGRAAQAGEDAAQGNGHNRAAPQANTHANAAPKTAGYNVAYVGNIAFEVDADALSKLFESYGVEKVRLHTDKDTGRSKGFAHIHFVDEESLDRAMTLDGTSVMGRKIRMGYALPKKTES